MVIGQSNGQSPSCSLLVVEGVEVVVDILSRICNLQQLSSNFIAISSRLTESNSKEVCYSSHFVSAF